MNYTEHVGIKFNKDGTFKQFAGNTIISFIDKNESIFNELLYIQEEFKKLPFSHKFTFLPPESFHMTLIELVCDHFREESKWSSKLSLDTPIETVDKVFYEDLKNIPFPDDIKMKVSHIDKDIVRLLPFNEAYAQALSKVRNEVADTTKVRFDGHDNYGFHITFMYIIKQLTEEEQVQMKKVSQNLDNRLHEKIDYIHINKPEYVIFEDMSEFRVYTGQNRSPK